MAIIGGYLFLGHPVQFVIEQPGPAFNVLGKTGGKPVISISGAKTYPVSGSLDALTVELLGTPEAPPSWLEVELAKLDPSKGVIAMNVVYPEGVKSSVIEASDAAQMRASQQDAQAAAYTYLGIKFKSRVYVESMMSDSAAIKLIKPGDFITSLNGEPMSNGDVLRQRVKAWDGKTAFKVGIERNGAQSVVTVKPKKIDGKYYIGVYIGYRYVFPIKTEVYLGDVSGPSAGTMFALGIIDKLTPGQLFAGKHVGGTGTIEPNGQVGPIGGIVQKMFGAKRAGATVFLAPGDNCSETIGKAPAGLAVYRIDTLSEAVALIEAIDAGKSLSAFKTCTK